MNLIHYNEATKDNFPKENTPEYDYTYFTKYNNYSRVDFDGETFICYHESMNHFKIAMQNKLVHSTYDNYRGKIYKVEHKIL